MESAIKPHLRRPNGRPQACEQCRKRKVACDHTHPICRRCKKRNSQCDYVITKYSSWKPMPTSTPTVLVTPPPDPGANNPGIQPTPPSSTDSPSALASAAPTLTPDRPGYLGFTSFSPVYEEVARVQGASREILLEASSGVGSRPGGAKSPMILSPDEAKMCLTVLREVPEQALAEEYFANHVHQNDGWIRPAAKHMLHSLYQTFGSYLGPNRDDSSLLELALIFSANSSKPLEEEDTDPELWMSRFSGRNFRWESLGALFNYWEFGYSTRPPHRREVPTALNRNRIKHTGRIFKDMTKLCIDLSKDAGGSSLLLFVVYSHSILESVYSGDACLSFWRLHGEVAALATFLGLHVGSNHPTYTPSIASEVKRRLFARIYYIDKVVSSFTGRPPLLSRRYTSTPLPLDIPDEILLSDQATLIEAMHSLDENGWNTVGGVYSATISRARASLCMNKDEILEIALGNGLSVSIETLLALKSRCQQTIQSFPSVLIYHPDNLRDPDLSRSTLYTRVLIRLEYLQNVFFIERLLLQRGHDGRADLLAVSFEMITLTLNMWTHMDPVLGGMTHCLEWLVMAYAAPAGGILCMELLKPTLRGSHPHNSTITRSTIIQQLSLLIGFLDWVGPTAPNGDLCSSCKEAILYVLDQTLNPPVTGDAGLGILDWDLSTNLPDYFNFDLLDTFDFLRPEANTGQQLTS